MGLFKSVSKLGLFVSFATAIAYEITGSNILKAVSLATGTLSLAIIISYIQSIRQVGGARDMLRYFRLLK